MVPQRIHLRPEATHNGPRGGIQMPVCLCLTTGWVWPLLPATSGLKELSTVSHACHDTTYETTEQREKDYGY